MFLGFIVPILALGASYALGGLDYLRRLLLPSSPSSTPLAPPYTPPFTNGQCVGVSYQIGVKVYDSTGSLIFENPTLGFLLGAITEVPLDVENQQGEIFTALKGQTSTVLGGWRKTSPNPLRVQTGQWTVTRSDGSSVSCGDPPNPNAGQPTSSDGLSDSPAPNPEEDSIRVIEGSPLATIPNFGAALTSALNAARNAADALAGIAGLANAIDALRDLMDAVKDKLDEEDKDKKRDTYRLDIGSVSTDGFLRLYPSENAQKFKAELLDVQVLSIPPYYGKYFGNKSPHFYRFKELGYIAFVSPTFGVMEYREIEFSRMSLSIPDDCIGFFYHFGLEGEIFANLSAFYTAPKQDEEE